MTSNEFNALPRKEKIKQMQAGDIINDRGGNNHAFIRYEPADWFNTPEIVPNEPVIPGGRIIGSGGCWNMAGKNYGLGWGDINDVFRWPHEQTPNPRRMGSAIPRSMARNLRRPGSRHAD